MLLIWLDVAEAKYFIGYIGKSFLDIDGTVAELQQTFQLDFKWNQNTISEM